MSDHSKIKLTEEELDNIIECFEKDRERITQEFGFDDNAEMYLQLFKSFRQQILDNQDKAGKFEKIKRDVADRKKFHALCENKFGSGSGMGQHHHMVWEELDKIDRNLS